jgi:tyrosyl-tRNA synthetase
VYRDCPQIDQPQHKDTTVMAVNQHVELAPEGVRLKTDELYNDFREQLSAYKIDPSTLRTTAQLCASLVQTKLNSLLEEARTWNEIKKIIVNIPDIQDQHREDVLT